MNARSRHIPPGSLVGAMPPRLVMLYVSARGMLGSVILVAALASLYGLLGGWAAAGATGGWGQGEVMKQFGLLQAVPALLAGVIGISAWSPFGEVERTAATSLARLRLAHIGVLLGLGIGVSWVWLADWTSRQPDVDPGPVAVRNLLGLVGCALLVGRFLDARLSWVLPLGVAVVTVFTAFNGAPDEVWTPPATIWNGQAQDSMTGWLIAVTFFAVGGALFLRDGAKDASGDEE